MIVRCTFQAAERSWRSYFPRMTVVQVQADFVDDEAPTLVKTPSSRQQPVYRDTSAYEATPETRRSGTLEAE